jgi:copper(I)-binding protein
MTNVITNTLFILRVIMKINFLQTISTISTIALISFSSITFASSDKKNSEFRVGQIKVENPYTRATVAGQKVAGGFMKIENKGAADQLISASSPIAAEMQLHTMSMEGNVMKMREVKAIDVPANGSVDLKPGGLHLMFMDIKAPLKAGESVPVKLKFQKAGEIEIKVPVREMSAGSGHMKH